MEARFVKTKLEPLLSLPAFLDRYRTARLVAWRGTISICRPEAAGQLHSTRAAVPRATHRPAATTCWTCAGCCST